MTRLPIVNSRTMEKLLRSLGFEPVRQKGSHIRLQKHTHDEVLKLTVPAHRPIKRSTLAHILKQARLTVEKFNALS